MFRRIPFKIFAVNFGAAIIGAAALRAIAAYPAWSYFSIAACIFAILFVTANVFASRRIQNDLRKIANAAIDAAEGNLDARASVKSEDEIRDAANAVNDMIGSLQTDILELKKLEQYRREFLGNVSHELRTPAFTIQGYIESLQRGAINDPVLAEKFLERAHSNLLRLNTLVNDLMEISQIESGEMRMRFRYFDIAPLLQQVVEELEPGATLKNLSLALDLGTGNDEEIEVYGDKERIKQVLVNLVDNAIKYTDKGVITLSIRVEEHKTGITVSDTGMGIPREHLPRIFERFYRVDKNRSREAGGTGLGLAIVKHILEKHNTKMTVESEMGKGTTFMFMLEN